MALSKPAKSHELWDQKEVKLLQTAILAHGVQVDKLQAALREVGWEREKEAIRTKLRTRTMVKFVKDNAKRIPNLKDKAAAALALHHAKNAGLQKKSKAKAQGPKGKGKRKGKADKDDSEASDIELGSEDSSDDGDSDNSDLDDIMNGSKSDSATPSPISAIFISLLAPHVPFELHRPVPCLLP
jgi:hypothetical protein